MIIELISAFIQILVFTAIPFFVFLYKNKTAKRFSESIGLKTATSKAVKLAVVFSLVYSILFVVIAINNTSVLEIMHSPNSVTGKVKQMGLSIESIFTIFSIALLKTSCAEEIFFRGFLGKGLINKFGFKTGNIFQALIFGLIHIAMVALSSKNVFFLSLSFIFPTALAYAIGVLNEKIGKGSIIPGIVFHGLANILGYSIVGLCL